MEKAEIEEVIREELRTRRNPKLDTVVLGVIIFLTWGLAPDVVQLFHTVLVKHGSFWTSLIFELAIAAIFTVGFYSGCSSQFQEISYNLYTVAKAIQEKHKRYTASLVYAMTKKRN